MKSANINGLNSTQQARLQQSESVRPKDAATSGPLPAQSTPDQVSVSGTAGELGRLIARAGEFGDFRPERVIPLRQAIQSNRYHVSSSRIADAIIRDEGA